MVSTMHTNSSLGKKLNRNFITHGHILHHGVGRVLRSTIVSVGLHSPQSEVADLISGRNCQEKPGNSIDHGKPITFPPKCQRGKIVFQLRQMMQTVSHASRYLLCYDGKFRICTDDCSAYYASSSVRPKASKQMDSRRLPSLISVQSASSYEEKYNNSNKNPLPPLRRHVCSGRRHYFHHDHLACC